MGFLGGGGGDVAYVRIQNRSSKTIHITFLERENVADDNLDSLSGEIDPKTSFPINGGSQPFPNNANYASLKGTDGPFNAGRMVVEARVPGANKPTSTLTLIVNNGVWRMEDATPDFNSPIRLVADVNEEKDGSGKEFWKVELRVYDNCDTSKWMELLADKIDDMPLNRVGLPGEKYYHKLKMNVPSLESNLTIFYSFLNLLKVRMILVLLRSIRPWVPRQTVT